jgi:hypothetical protein
MADQNLANHRQTVPIFHQFLIPVLALTIIGAGVNVAKSIGDHERLYSASLIFVLAVCMAILAIVARIFSLKAQDRAIRAEENLRHFAMTGKLLDSRLSIKQTVALRFASDGEFVELARKAAESGTAPGEIKQSIKQWRADTYRA